jgi:hypothetical protein
MKYFLLGLLGLSVLLGCGKSDPVGPPAVTTPPGTTTTTPGTSTTTTPGTSTTATPADPVSVSQTATGEWTGTQDGAGGFGNVSSFRNFQYTVQVRDNNQPVTIELTSPDINIQYALFDLLGQRIDITLSGRSVKSSRPYVLNQGAYRVVVMADRRAVGRFTLIMQGINGAPTSISSQTIGSNTQNWGTLGGGGMVRTFKNHFYTFDVTEDNLGVDITLLSADTDVWLMLYDPLGQAIGLGSGMTRYTYSLQTLRKGTYTVMAATAARGGVGNYQMSIVGKVANLKRVESQVNTVTGIWPSNQATDTYALSVTVSSSPLDLELLSPETKAFIQLQDNAGGFVSNGGNASNTQTLVYQTTTRATYRVQINPLRISGGPGSYTLTVHGQFADMKKL